MAVLPSLVESLKRAAEFRLEVLNVGNFGGFPWIQRWF